jgi:hypothetical protein
MKLPYVDSVVSGAENNWAGAAGDGAVVLLVKNVASISVPVRGIANGVHGRLIFIVLTNGPDISFPNGHSSAPAGSRLYIRGGGSIAQDIATNGSIAFWYDANYLGVGAWVQVGYIVP